MYLLDADVFIRAKNSYYGLDFCPGFWEWLRHAHLQGKVFSIDRVRDELLAGEDELKAWVTQLPPSFFFKPSSNTVESLKVIAEWADQAALYEPGAKAAFLARADYYLVAQARAYGYAVVTNEVAADKRTQIKIPNACAAHSIPVRTPFDLLRNERARFVASFSS